MVRNETYWFLASTIVERINDGLAKVDGRPWTKGFVRGRDKQCQLCRRTLRSGDKSYRPVVEGEGVVRWMRLCVRCVEGSSANG